MRGEDDKMSEITIIKGEEFKIAVKKEIKRDDIFISEYRRAAVMLDEIAGRPKKKKKFVHGRRVILKIILLHFAGSGEKEKAV